MPNFLFSGTIFVVVYCMPETTLDIAPANSWEISYLILLDKPGNRRVATSAEQCREKISFKRRKELNRWYQAFYTNWWGSYHL